MYYNIKQLTVRYCVSPATIWRWVKSGHFPQPVKLGPGTTRWQEADLEEFEGKLGKTAFQ